MTKGTSILRVRNLKRVVSHLRIEKTSSRQALSQALNLSKNTISLIVDELISLGKVVETGAEGSKVGRPRIEIQLVPDAFHSVGVHIRRNLFEMVVTDYTGRIVHSESFQVDTGDALACVRSVIEQCVKVLSRFEGILGIGIAVPGMVNPLEGFVHLSTHLGWADVPITKWIQTEITHPPVVVLNRVMAAAHAVPERADSTFYIRIDEGVGGAFVMGREAWTGASYTAGEIGHICVDPDGPVCRCGQRGCLEAMVNLSAFQQRMHADFPQNVVGLDEGNVLQIDPLLDDDVLNQLMKRFGGFVGRALGTVVNVVNPALVVVDSPYNQWEGFSSAVIHATEKLALRYPMRHTRFEFADNGHSSALGMAMYVITNYENADA